MTREEQDKRWAELSEESKQARIKAYNELLELNSDSELWKYNFALHDLEELYGKHNLQSSLSYEDVARALYNISTGTFGIPERDFNKKSDVKPWNYFGVYSKEAQQKVIAIIKLLNVAKFLNKNEDGSDWVLNIEDWDDKNEDFYTLGIDPADNEVYVIPVNKFRFATEIVYFRTKELAEQAIQILGEDCIRTALTTDY